MKNYEVDITISREFLHICQAQLTILIHSFFVQEFIVYLAKNNETEGLNLTPIFVYPNGHYSSSPNALFYLPEDEISPDKSSNFHQNFDRSLLSQEITVYNSFNADSSSPYELILPLIYEEIFLGLLVIKRYTNPWQEREILQLKEIAKIITLSRFLEQKQQLTDLKLTQIQKLRSIENDQVADFLHQLGNPLTAIRTFAKVLLKRFLPVDKNYPIIENIIRESDRIRDLIRDFQQQWNGVESDKIITLNDAHSSFFLPEQIQQLELINIINIIDPLIQSLQVIAEEKNIILIHDYYQNFSPILSNEKALREILNNLLENAIKYTPNYGKILVDITQEKESLIIKIADTGLGIPPEDHDRIFERHYRGVQADGNIQGTGLGLSIVKELCDKIGIKISFISPFHWVKNQQNKGTQFTLYIPLKQ